MALKSRLHQAFHRLVDDDDLRLLVAWLELHRHARAVDDRLREESLRDTRSDTLVGRLNGSRNADGFGLASTKNRLQLLFGQKANFDIREVNGNTVEARVLIPVDLSK